MLILSELPEDKTRVLISTGVGKVFKVVIDMPGKFGREVSEYFVGGQEKDFLVKVFKDKVLKVKEIRIEYHSDDLNMSSSTSLKNPEI